MKAAWLSNDPIAAFGTPQRAVPARVAEARAEYEFDRVATAWAHTVGEIQYVEEAAAAEKAAGIREAADAIARGEELDSAKQERREKATAAKLEKLRARCAALAHSRSGRRAPRSSA